MSEEEHTAILTRTTIQGLNVVTPESDKRSACFIVLTGSNAGRMYKLEANSLIIGRTPGASIRIDDDGVSRVHARLVCSDDGEVRLLDNNSTNGTYCNGDKVDERILNDGDKVQIGTTTILKFSYQDSLDEDFTRRQYESVTRDGLTGCFNKKYFHDRVETEFSFAKRHQSPLALAMLDIDFFKKVNDTYGHQAGDYVLKEVAAAIQNLVRTDDVLARYGGEEFALIMRETTAEAAFIVTERVRRKIEGLKLCFEGAGIPVTISIGFSVSTDNKYSTATELLKKADDFLYKAKENGRNRTECELV